MHFIDIHFFKNINPWFAELNTKRHLTAICNKDFEIASCNMPRPVD